MRLLWWRKAKKKINDLAQLHELRKDEDHAYNMWWRQCNMVRDYGVIDCSAPGYWEAMQLSREMYQAMTAARQRRERYEAEMRMENRVFPRQT